MTALWGRLRWFGETVRSARAVWRQSGLRGLWFGILGRTIYRRLLLLERSLDEPLPAIEPRVQFEFSEFEARRPSDFEILYVGNSPAEIADRFAAGHRCFTARHNGKIVAIKWAATGRVAIDYLNVDICLEPEAVYVYDAFTDPAYRGLNIQPAMSVHLFEQFRREHRRRIVSAALPESRSGLRLGRKLGFPTCGALGCVRLGPWRWNFQRRGTTITWQPSRARR